MSRIARVLLLEPLDDRRLLAADLFHNSLDPLDVNCDGARTPADLGEVLSDQVLHGSRRLATDSPDAPGRPVDVNGDGLATPGDMAELLAGLLLDASYLPASATEGGDQPESLVESRWSIQFSEGWREQAGMAVAEAEGQADFDALIQLIAETIQPDSWELAGGSGTIQWDRGSHDLMIRQTQQIQDEIGDLLKQLRALQSTMVTVEVRFVTLQDDFFQRIGVDFDFTIDDLMANLPQDADAPGYQSTWDGTGAPNVSLVGFGQNSNPQLLAPPVSGDYGYAALSETEQFVLGDGQGFGQVPWNGTSVTSTVQLPNLQTTTVSTTVSLPDGGVVLLGGSYQLHEGRIEPGAVWVGQLCYIRRLFINQGVGHDSESLTLMVTPRIIINQEEQSQ